MREICALNNIGKVSERLMLMPYASSDAHRKFHLQADDSIVLVVQVKMLTGIVGTSKIQVEPHNRVKVKTLTQCIHQ